MLPRGSAGFDSPRRQNQECGRPATPVTLRLGAFEVRTRKGGGSVDKQRGKAAPCRTSRLPLEKGSPSARGGAEGGAGDGDGIKEDPGA